MSRGNAQEGRDSLKDTHWDLESWVISPNPYCNTTDHQRVRKALCQVITESTSFPFPNHPI